MRATLVDTARFVSGGTPSKARPDYWDGSFPWLSAKDMKRLRIEDTEDHLSDTALAGGARLMPAGTVFLLTRGMTLLTDVPICVGMRPMAFNQDVKALVPKSTVDETFLPYLLLGHKDRLLSLVDLAGHGTGRLNSAELKALEIDLPPLDEQRAIASLLGALDDKIDLHQRMNQTLEASARALFRSWFVDFDPVRAKAEGRDPGMPHHLADLFPNRFHASELGFIPAGWTAQPLGNLLELAYGRALKQDTRRPGPIPVFGSNGQVGWHDERLATGPGIIVGRKGNPGVVTWVQTDFFAIDTTFFVVPKPAYPSLYFMFFALGEHDLASLGADSAVPGLNRNMAYLSKQIAPPLPVLEAFDAYVAPMFARRHAANLNSQTLSAVRDTLLPKLVSGEIRVTPAERLVGAASS